MIGVSIQLLGAPTVSLKMSTPDASAATETLTSQDIRLVLTIAVPISVVVLLAAIGVGVFAWCVISTFISLEGLGAVKTRCMLVLACAYLTAST